MKAAERVLARVRPDVQGFDPTLVIVIVQVIVMLIEEWRKCHQDKPILTAAMVSESVFRRRAVRFVRRQLLAARLDESNDTLIGNAIIDELLGSSEDDVKAILAA